MKEDKEKPPKIKKTQKKKNMKEQWDFEAAPHGYVLPEVLRLFYSFKARQMLNNTSCASSSSKMFFFFAVLICAEC